jgi:CRISPR-associated protein Cmr1
MTSSVPNELPLMPTPRKGRFRGVPQAEFQVALKFVTPVLGGGVKAGFFDAVDLVRVPSVRGHLRFWWRALLPPEVDRTRMLQLERALWGGMNSNDDDGAASRVVIRITSAEGVKHVGDRPYGDKPRYAPQHSYASFSARDDRKTPSELRDTDPSAKFTKADGLAFTLHVSCPHDKLPEVENAVRSWVLFGGYGSRTRRGMGSLTVTTDRERWLPAAATRDAIVKLFGSDPFSSGARDPGDTARLAGATLMVAAVRSPQATPQQVWQESLDALAIFRQGANVGRNPSPDGGKRLGRSRWPEPDYIRHLSGSWPAVHAPKFNGAPVWPRAQFGLPIGGEFVQTDRTTEETYRPPEPGKFEIKWEPAEELVTELPRAEADRLGDRLASPLIVKALPLCNGQYVKAALWLNRGFPNGVVVGGEKTGSQRGRADFGEVHATEEPKPHPHRALDGKKSMRDAFLGWLKESGFVEIPR